MANLKRGSTGEEVVEVQRIVGVKDDGIFGPDTEAAVKQYQKNNGLVADGIVGPDTRGVMFKTTKTNTGGNTGTKPATPSGAAPVTSPGGVTYGDFTYDSFDPGSSETIQQAQTLLDQNNANKPGAWVDPYQSQYMDYLNKYANRDPFSYDFNSDALYQQYRDNYILQGQMAMMDTMGQAAAMTGGYGNSYAQSVGQQAYNQHLNQLNDIIPELYGMAYDRYKQEGQDLLNMYNIYKGLSDDSYGRHQDDVDNWYREDTRLTNNYNTAYGQEWDKYSLGYDTAWSEYLTDRSENFQTEQNEAEWARQDQANAKSDLITLITSTGYKPTASELKAAGMTAAQAEGYAKAYTESKTTTTEYSDLDHDTQQKWITEAKNGAQTWGGLNSVWGRMKTAEHNPMSSAELILDYALNNGITPTAADLDSFQTKLEKAGLTNAEAAAFIREWAMEFGLVDQKPLQKYPTSTGGGGGGRHMVAVK